MSTMGKVEMNGLEITIYKDWHIGGKVHWTSSTESSPTSTSKSLGSGSEKRGTGRSKPDQKFAFVNTTHIGKTKDPDIRKFVRAHVRKDYLRKHQSNGVRKSTRRSPPNTQLATPAPSSPSMDLLWYDTLVIEDAIGVPTSLSLSPWPINMTYKMHQLLSRYLTHVSSSMYPLSEYLSSNPIRSPEWFRFAVNDPLMLHGVIYAGAIYIALLEGRRDSEDSVTYLAKATEMVNERLQTSEQVDDGVLAALSCIALGEASTGHLDQWHVHMRGIQQMINTRGTISSLPVIIQTKLRRSDVSGAIDYAAVPYLRYERVHTGVSISRVLRPQIVRNINVYVSFIFTQHGIHAKLREIMLNVALFSQSINYASNTGMVFDPEEFSDDLYWIEYQLLTFPTSLSGQVTAIDEATRIGALLFMKSILQEYPHSTTGPSILLQKLQKSLSTIDITKHDRQWLIWLCAIGALLSKPMTRTWFVEKLAGLRTMECLEELDVQQQQIFPIPADTGCRNIDLWSLLDLGRFIGEHDLLLLWEDVQLQLEGK
ncbi:hypothetical protein ACMFMG_005473 [Clarireedia jacksonii]